MTLKFYLDTRRSVTLHPLKIRINIGATSALIGTHIKLEAAHWDAKRQRVIVRPDKASVNMRLSRMLFDLQDFYDGLQTKHRITAGELKRLYEKQDADKEGATLFGLFDAVINTKRNIRTMKLYKVTLNSIRGFSPDIAITEVTPDWLRRYDDYLVRKGLAVNTRRGYLCNLCAVCNYAVREDLLPDSPFRKFRIPQKGRPRKRALTVEQLRTLLSVNDCSPIEKESIDIFFLIFSLIGINFADLVSLDGVHHGRIEYDRHKTKRFYSVKVFPEAQQYIKKLKGEERLIKTHTIGCIDKHLRAIGKRVLGFEITTYWARHSWASIAINDCDIDKDTISYALGHTLGSQMTSIYIDYDLKKVDKANRKVLDLVFGKPDEDG